MKRRLLWLSLPILLGLAIAAIAVAAPAQAAKSQAEAYSYGMVDPNAGEAFGVVQSYPGDLVGAWTIGEAVYTATSSTEFEMESGSFHVGACVHVIFDPSTYTAMVIGTESGNKCSSEGDGGLRLTGLIDQVPTGTITGTTGISGTWVISGVAFTSTPDTDLESEHGPLVVGACATVEYQAVNGENLAKEIRSEEIYRCLGPVAFNQASGYLETFPTNLIGQWVISDTAGMTLTFMTTNSTKIVDMGKYPQQGDCVGVKYYNDGGTNYAVLVLSGVPGFCKGHFGSEQPVSKIIATVDSRPEGVITGTWTLAGVNFTATEQTRAEEEEGNPLAVGSCAEAKYDPTNGAMLIHQMEGEEMEDCQDESGAPRFKLFGVIEVMPSGGYSGTWQVSGVTFTASPSTTVVSRHGEFAVGAYVKVLFTYDAASGERTAEVIQTHVAPGFGMKNFHGHFEGWINNPSGDQLVVDGQTYNADPDIDAPADLQKGDLVWLNAYQENGATYVTQVSLAQELFLPVLTQK